MAACVQKEIEEISVFAQMHLLYLLPDDVHVMNPNWQNDVFGTFKLLSS